MAAVVQNSVSHIKRGPTRTVSVRDLVLAAFLPIQFLVSWCLPERLWFSAVRMFEPLAAYLYVRGGRRQVENTIRSFLGTHADAELPHSIVKELALDELISYLQIFRDYRPGRWQPKMKLNGAHHLDAALEQGKGAILWVAYAHGAKLTAKLAIHQAGYAVSHLSRPRHGLSPTRFGIRYLNKVQTIVEDRYIAERIMIRDGEFQKAVRSLHARLRANKVVSITVHREATRPTVVPFLHGRISLADGACRLAYRTGAALLPIFTYRDGSGIPVVDIDPPIEMSQAETEEASVHQAHLNYSTRLETYVLAYPGQWRGWYLYS